MSRHVKISRQLDDTWTVFTSAGTSWWAIGADFPDAASAQRVADVIEVEAIGFAGSPRENEVTR